jgi:hypothetical protein
MPQDVIKAVDMLGFGPPDELKTWMEGELEGEFGLGVSGVSVGGSGSGSGGTAKAREACGRGTCGRGTWEWEGTRNVGTLLHSSSKSGDKTDSGSKGHALESVLVVSRRGSARWAVSRAFWATWGAGGVRRGRGVVRRVVRERELRGWSVVTVRVLLTAFFQFFPFLSFSIVHRRSNFVTTAHHAPPRTTSHSIRQSPSRGPQTHVGDAQRRQRR